MNENIDVEKLIAKAYQQAINFPPELLKNAFKAEADLFDKYLEELPKGSKILDMGCGIVRPLAALAEKHPDKQYIGIDISDEILKCAKGEIRIYNLPVFIIKDDALNTMFRDNLFDITYSTYNVIGSIDKKDRNSLIKEKARVTKKGGKIITITWANDSKTTAFLAYYYQNLGAKIDSMNQFETETNIGTYYRIPISQLEHIYQKNSIKPIDSGKLADVWTYIVGVKI